MALRALARAAMTWRGPIMGSLAAKMLALALLAGLMAPGTAAPEVGVPGLRARVTDLTDTLTRQQQSELEQRLASFEQRKGSQIAVLLIPTTQPETIEQYGIRVVDQWQLGRKAVDDGALILLAKEDRAVRIEVGRGLEGVIPDAIAKRVVEDIMIPHFRQDDFYGGISAGVEQLIRLVEGEPLPEPAWHGHPTRRINTEGAFFSFFGSIVVGHFLRIIVGRLLAGLMAAGLAGLLLTGVYGLPLSFGLILALIVLVFTIGDSGRGGGGYYYGGGYGGRYRGSGYGGGGLGTGFDPDSGGFSGGGGGFSGGGASGRW